MAEVGRLSWSTNSNSSFVKGIFPILGQKNCLLRIGKLLQKGIFWNMGSSLLSKVPFLYLWMPNSYSWYFSPNLMKKLILQYTDDSTLWMQFVFTYKIWSSRENWYNSYKKGSRVSDKQCRFILWFVGITGCIKLSRQRIRIFSDLNSRDDIRGTIF